MPERNKRLMQPDEVRDFVNDVIAAGYEINAVGHNMYVFGEAGNVEKLNRIGEKYGDRDFVRLEIVAYLRSIGRFVDVT